MGGRAAYAGFLIAVSRVSLVISGSASLVLVLGTCATFAHHVAWFATVQAEFVVETPFAFFFGQRSTRGGSSGAFSGSALVQVNCNGVVVFSRDATRSCWPVGSSALSKGRGLVQVIEAIELASFLDECCHSRGSRGYSEDFLV